MQKCTLSQLYDYKLLCTIEILARNNDCNRLLIQETDLAIIAYAIQWEADFHFPSKLASKFDGKLTQRHLKPALEKLQRNGFIKQVPPKNDIKRGKYYEITYKGEYFIENVEDAYYDDEILSNTDNPITPYQEQQAQQRIELEKIYNKVNSLKNHAPSATRESEDNPRTTPVTSTLK